MSPAGPSILTIVYVILSAPGRCLYPFCMLILVHQECKVGLVFNNLTSGQ